MRIRFIRSCIVLYVLTFALVVTSTSPVVHAQTNKTITCPTNGRFNVVGPVICDPEGKPFLPRGLNVMGANSYVASANAHGRASHYKNIWNFNTVRLVYCETCVSHSPGSANYGTLDSFIQEYTALKMVVIIDNHEGNFCTDKSEAVAFAQRFFPEVAQKYKDNPYVWFETYNEPMVDDQVNQWVSLQEPVVKSIRDAGNTNIVVLNEPSCGQGRDGNNVNGRFDPSDSGAITRGKEFVDKYKNILFDTHIYSRYAYGTTDADLKAYFDAVHAKGLAIFVGETGAYNETFEIVPGDRAGTERLYRVKPNGVGITMWAQGFFFDDSEAHTGLPTNLHWSWSHSPPNAWPDGYTVTTGAGGLCPTTKNKGDADCLDGPTILDHGVWRSEYLGTLGTDRDGDGALMDADFDGDGQVKLADYAIWLAGYKAANP